MKKKNQPLQGKVEKGLLIVSIGIDTLAFAFEHQDSNNPYVKIESDDGLADYDFVQQCKVIDNEEFAKDVLNELFREEEDGSNPINILLDKVCDEAVNQGSTGIEHKEWK